MNIVNNFYSSPGSAIGRRKQAIIVRGTSSRDVNMSGCSGGAEGYVSGNLSADAAATKVDINTNPEWIANNQTEPFEATPVATTDACDALDFVLAEAGALPRDSFDNTLVAQPWC